MKRIHFIGFDTSHQESILSYLDDVRRRRFRGGQLALQEGVDDFLKSSLRTGRCVHTDRYSTYYPTEPVGNTKLSIFLLLRTGLNGYHYTSEGGVESTSQFISNRSFQKTGGVRR